ncbi:MAG: DUF1611 domain-containing protein [Bacteroidota bacterium]|nr:DUF1611 domain-containing protein [Bacteroidota bacterium]MDP4196382.1 DUF1611 domain-containing protein [Bacteroidota bacterium]
MHRRIVILSEGFTNPHHGKTARNLIYYKPEEVVAIFDRTQAGKTSIELLGVGDIPVVGSFDEINDPDTLLIGVATPGGKLPESYKDIILQAIKRKLNVICGLHDFLSDDPQITSCAKENNVKLLDIRKNAEHQVVNRKGINENCLRIHTVGNDCSLGKMIVSLELNKALLKRGYDAKFVATGQTGILIEGDGIPMDAVVGDFINGAAEKLVLMNQHHEIINIEGQGSLVHPRYSSVTLGLLHGCMPHGMIMCYEMGRQYIHGMDNIKIPSLQNVINLYESVSSVMHPSKVIALALNSRRFSKQEAEIEKEKIKDLLSLPICDVIRDGADELADAVIKLKEERLKTPLLI